MFFSFLYFFLVFFSETAARKFYMHTKHTFKPLPNPFSFQKAILVSKSYKKTDLLSSSCVLLFALSCILHVYTLQNRSPAAMTKLSHYKAQLLPKVHIL